MDSRDWIFQQYIKELANKREPLSAEFLLNRGECCGNVCTNCPYEPKHVRGNNVTNSSKKTS